MSAAVNRPAGAWPPRSLTVARIIVAVSEQTGVPVRAIRSERRSAEIARARHTAMLVARRRLEDWSWKRLGREFDRDHSTVMHAVTGVEARLVHDAELRDLVARVEATLNKQEGSV